MGTSVSKSFMAKTVKRGLTTPPQDVRQIGFISVGPCAGCGIDCLLSRHFGWRDRKRFVQNLSDEVGLRDAPILGPVMQSPLKLFR